MNPVDMVDHTERLYAVVRRELGGGLISRTPDASGFLNRTRKLVNRHLLAGVRDALRRN